jgi:hypothetical protein
MATPAVVWHSDASELLADQIQILKGMEKIQKAAVGISGGDVKILEIDKLAKAYKTSTDDIVTQINLQKDAIQQLDDVQKQYAKGGRAAAQKYVQGRAAQHLAYVTGQNVPDTRTGAFDRVFPSPVGPGATGNLKGTEALRESAELARKEITKLEKDFIRLNEVAQDESLAQAKVVDPALYHDMNRLVLRRGDIERKANQITSGEAVNDVLRDRMKLLEGELRLLESQRSAIEANAKAQQAPKQQRTISAAQANINKADEAEKKLFEAYQEIERIQKRSGVARQKGAGLLSGLTSKDAKVVEQVLRNIQNVDPKAAAELEKQVGLIEKYGKAFSEAHEAQKEGLGEQKKIQTAIGADPALDHLTKQINNVKAAMADTVSASTDTLFPGLQEDIARLAEIDRRFKQLRSQTGAEAQRLTTEREQITVSARGKLDAGVSSFAATQPLSSEQMIAELTNKLPLLEQTFVKVFSDMQRRFIATFQFAISGALIFGTVKMVKEFVETAIEVERAFADIESALEFDISDARGTVGFKTQVEAVRQDVLALANEFNVLPTEANKSAFVMISRFSDMSNAMQATKAQLLAVKVSTIAQSETLRALTAVSEGFAAVQLEVNDGMSLQERLMAKENASAQLYGKALDLAVTIQQKFGVEVEDTLEGTARATEVFRQMGFSMEETAAIVASTSRQLGQTGQQAAERLVRSLGQLTDPKIRDALLDLAAGSTEFSLSISDFASGAKAWETITRQFSRLEGSAPDVARAILQIVGQRRELEAVAAALGTADLQREMLNAAQTAAGAAERRFSFLKGTVVEMMTSIRTGFQELAQNFERLGGLSTLKILLRGVDLLVGALNAAMKLVIDFVTWLDKFAIMGKGIGSIATQIAAVTLAAYGLLRVAVALQKTFLLLSGTAGLQNLAAAMGVSQGVAVVGGVAAAGGAADIASPVAVGFAARMGAMAGAAKASTTAMLAMIPVWGWMAIGIGATALAMSSLKDRTDFLAATFTSGSAAISKAAIDARRQIRDEGLVGLDAKAVEQRAYLEALQTILASSKGASPSNVDMFGAVMRDVLAFGSTQGPDYTETGWNLPEEEDRFRAVNLRAVLERRFHPELYEGGTEMWQLLTDEALEALVATQREAVEGEIAGFNFDEYDLTDPKYRDDLPELQRIIGPSLKNLSTPVTTDLVQTEIARMYEASIQAFLDDMPEKGLLLADQAAAKWDTWLSIVGKLPANMTKSMTGLSTELAGLDTKVALGQMTAEEAIESKLRIAQEMKTQARQAEIQWPNMKEEWTQWYQDAENAQLEGMRAAIAELNFQQDAGEYGEGVKERLERQIALFEESGINLEDYAPERRWEAGFPEGVTTGGGIPPEVQAEWDENEARLRELAENEVLVAIKVAEHAVAMAEGLAEETAAAEQLTEAFEGAIALYKAWGSNEEQVADYVRRIEINNKVAKKDSSADARRLAEARVRMSGAILDPILAIQAQIAGIRAELAAGGLEMGERLALQVQLNEAIAHESQAQMAKVRAYAESQVGARNAMRANQLELTLLVRELALTALLFGKGSVEWSNLTKAITNMKVALMDQALELESIQRLLDADLTDPYVKTQLALIDAIQQQKAVYADLDSGDLEKGRADLAVLEAEIADEAAFAADRLFTMQFDYDRGAITKGQYISGLQKFLAEIDTTTKAGKELWQQVNGLIEGMTGDLSDMQFNIPGEIRLPTLFEVRKSLAADQMGVNYMDNRMQDIRIYVNSDVDVAKVADAVNEGLGSQVGSASARYAPGASTMTMGSV